MFTIRVDVSDVKLPRYSVNINFISRIDAKLSTFCIRVLKIRVVHKSHIPCLSSTIITRLPSNKLDRTFTVVHGEAPRSRFIVGRRDDDDNDDDDGDQNRAKTRAPIQGALTQYAWSSLILRTTTPCPQLSSSSSSSASSAACPLSPLFKAHFESAGLPPMILRRVVTCHM